MSRTKACWTGKPSGYGSHLLTGDHAPRYTVHLLIELDRDPDRPVEVLFRDPDHAETVGRGLIRYGLQSRMINIRAEAARFIGDGGQQDVHTGHCCRWHGCKYDLDETCSVARPDWPKPQSYPCEECDQEVLDAEA
jgi:hypothetical protein